MELVASREHAYGPVCESFAKIARVRELITGPGDTPAMRELLSQLAMKLVRRTYSPEEPDHTRDARGYLVLIDSVQEAGA